MPFYVEFPTDPVVNVSWKKKNGDGGGEDNLHVTCGAWTKSMYHLPVPATGFDYWILYGGGLLPTGDSTSPFRFFDGGLYGRGVDTTPGHDPDKPAGYFPVNEPPIYLWTGPPGGWTVTYYFDPAGGTTPVRVGLWRGFSLHTLAKTGWPGIPPTEIGAADLFVASMDIIPDPELDKDLPLIFGLVAGGGTTADWGHGMGLFQHSIPDIVQAHCCVDAEGAPKPGPCIEETIGAPPPPPWKDQPQTPPYVYDFSNPAVPYPVP